MKLLVDGDACPVWKEILEVGLQFPIRILEVASYAHTRSIPLSEKVETITADPDREAADLIIINLAEKGDIAVTQDIGLSSILLAKDVLVLHPRGQIFDNEKIDLQLEMRAIESKVRRSGKRTKGPKKLTTSDRLTFRNQLEKILAEKQDI